MANNTDTIINRLQDPDFALGFIVDNNPVALMQALAAAGYPVANSIDALKQLKTLLMAAATREKAIAIISDIKYDNNATNGTGGLADYFIRNTPPSYRPTQEPIMKSGLFNWAGTFAALGSALGTYAGYVGGAAPSGTGGYAQVPNSAELAAMEAKRREEEEKKKKEEAERKRKMWIGIGIGVAVVVVIVIVISMRKKKTAA